MTRLSRPLAALSFFATTQQACEEGLTPQFHPLGQVATEADGYLFTTLLRFDPVDGDHFKGKLRRLVDYPTSAPTPVIVTRLPAWQPGESAPHQGA